jgi:hypothetical protein
MDVRRVFIFARPDLWWPRKLDRGREGSGGKAWRGIKDIYFYVVTLKDMEIEMVESLSWELFLRTSHGVQGLGGR